MRKLISLLFVAAFVPLFVFTSCRKDDDDDPAAKTDYETLTEYLVANDMDLPDVLASWIVGRPATLADVPAFLDTYDILDIRGATDFAEGHIDGAINATLANLLDKASATTKPILVVCYTGQTAAHAVVALHLSGYDDSVLLKFGMDGWNTTLASSGKWAANSGDTNGVIGIGHANWTKPAAIATNATFDDVEFNATATDGAGILAERVDYMLANGFKGVASSAVLTTPSDYFINNYWDEPDVTLYGHIDTAYRIKPLSIENGEVNNLNPDEQVVTYCWTGQTSSMVTAYLTVIGYDAASLKFGVNSMIYTDLAGHKYSVPPVDYPIVN